MFYKSLILIDHRTTGSTTKPFKSEQSSNNRSRRAHAPNVKLIRFRRSIESCNSLMRSDVILIESTPFPFSYIIGRTQKQLKHFFYYTNIDREEFFESSSRSVLADLPAKDQPLAARSPLEDALATLRSLVHVLVRTYQRWSGSNRQLTGGASDRSDTD